MKQKVLEHRAVGTMGCWNNGLSEQWVYFRNCGLSEQWAVGTVGILSELWAVGAMSRRNIGKSPSKDGRFTKHIVNN